MNPFNYSSNYMEKSQDFAKTFLQYIRQMVRKLCTHAENYFVEAPLTTIKIRHLINFEGLHKKGIF